MDARSETAREHVFETAGLGKAPFRLRRVYKKSYQACPGAPVQPGGACDYCGTGIHIHCEIEGADGSRFVVGSDCVAKTGDAGLRRVVQREVRRQQNERRREKRRQEREAALERQRDANEAAGHGRVTDGELDAQRRREREEAAEAARIAEIERSQWVGRKGERIDLDVTVVGVPYFDGHYGRVYIHLLDDADGNRVVWKTGTRLMVPTDDIEEAVVWRSDKGTGERPAVEGDRVRIRGTVKAHTTYEGRAQTELQRVAVRAGFGRCEVAA